MNFYIFSKSKKYLYLITLLFASLYINPLAVSSEKKLYKNQLYQKEETINFLKPKINWEFINEVNQKESINWEIIDQNEFDILTNKNLKYKKSEKRRISSLNRSIIFDDKIIGPDISWIIPPGFSWNKKYKFDFNIRGHNTSIPAPPKVNFFGWNSGDAVGLISYQFLDLGRSTLGINLGVRSIYEGSQLGGTTGIGEGLSGGFRWDYELTKSSGVAFGAEQLVHFDNLTDTGRNIYITASKGWWKNDAKGKESFPLDIATVGLGTGRMAIGNVKGLCSDLLGGDGTETEVKRPLCWSPIFSLARAWNEKFSTFFEYNSRFFLLGSSLAPIKDIPVRGTLALIISDHRDNYKIHDSSELTWTFNLSLGF